MFRVGGCARFSLPLILLRQRWHSEGCVFLRHRSVERGRRRANLEPDRPQIDLHRLDRGREITDAAMRRHGQEAVAGTRRQRAPHRLRRHRHRDGSQDLAPAEAGGAIASKYRNADQTCVCANRILVQDGVYDAFTKRLAKTAGAMKVADGFEPGAVVGPLIGMKAVEKVEAHIADAIKKGAKVVTGSKRAAQGDSFFEPTVLTDVTTDMVITKEETFGPVALLYRFKSEEDAVKMANDTEFGLASSAAFGASPKPSNTASSASTRGSSRPRSRRSAA
jgi:hypothetical protein